MLASQRSSIVFLRAAVVVGLGAALAWQVLMHSLVAHLAEASPEIALALRSDPSALLNIADRKLNLEHPSKDEAATPTRGEAGNRITSFARHARKAASSEPEQAAAEPASGAQGEATERLPLQRRRS